MNTDPNAVKILCFGDSNTWGRDPHAEGVRYPITIRWTGLLQKYVGNQFWVIEEGFPGRTTNLDDPDKVGKNGESYLVPCLITHQPLDFVILMLGTNDLKEKFDRTPSEVAAAVKNLIQIIKTVAIDKNGSAPQIILMSPPLVDESVPGVTLRYRGAEAKSKQLSSLYQQVALETDCSFIDISQIAAPSKVDGYHLDPEAHQSIAKKVSEIILDLQRKIGN